MKIEEAIKELLKKEHPRFKGRKMSKYQIANLIGVKPTMIDRWLSLDYVGLSDRVVCSFKIEFDIELTGYQSVMFIEDGTIKSSSI